MPKLRPTLQNLGLSVISLLVAVALLESGLRILAPDANVSPTWHYHQILGWVQNPGHSYNYVVSGEDVRVAYNSLGFRDVERSLDKPPDVRRALVIGDSFTAAMEVNLEDTFSRRLERILNARTTERWEVINLGVSDFGTAQEWLALEHLGMDYQPDVVIHQIFPLNDICNNGVDLAGLCKSTKDPYRPYFVEARGGLKLTSAQPMRNFLRRNLLIYRLGESAYARIAPRKELIDEDEYIQLLEEAGLPGLSPLLQTFVEDDRQIEPTVRAWRVTELLVERIVARCRERGAAYVGVVIPFTARVGAVWDRFAAAQPSPPMVRDYPERRLGRLFENLSITSVMMRPVFEDNTRLFFPDRGGHLNPAAHWLTAESIYQELRNAGLIAEDPARAERLKAPPRAPGDEFVAEPNPIQVCDGSGLGVTTLRWWTPGWELVEIHVGSPEGPLLARHEGWGSALTDKWVKDGMVFYLQDVSEDKPLTADHTFATVTARVTSAGCSERPVQ